MNQMKFKESHQQKVLSQLDTPPRKGKPRMLLLSSLTAAALVVILLGSALFMPAMENVVAKIPYISQFIKEEEQRLDQMENISDQVKIIAKENGLKIGNLQLRLEKKELKVAFTGLSGNEKNLSDQIQTQLGEAGLTGYEVTVVPFKEKEIQAERSKEEIEQDMRDSEALQATLTKRLKAEGYELMFPISVRINDIEGIFMNVIVPETEDRLDQLKEIMKEEAQVYGDEYKLDVRQVQKIAREQEKQWAKTGALGHIASALMEAKNLPVTGFAYSFHPYPLQITVKTSLNEGDPDAQQIAQEISSEIDLLIQSDEETEAIRDARYNVKVLSKDKKEIK